MDKGTALYGGIFLPTQAYEKAMSDGGSASCGLGLKRSQIGIGIIAL